jgi:hypothetical protein
MYGIELPFFVIVFIGMVIWLVIISFLIKALSGIFSSDGFSDILGCSLILSFIFPPLLLFTAPLWLLYVVFGLLSGIGGGSGRVSVSKSPSESPDAGPSGESGFGEDTDLHDEWMTRPYTKEENESADEKLQEEKDFWGF